MSLYHYEDEGRHMTQKHIDNDTLGLFVKTCSNEKNRGMDDTHYHQVLDHLVLCHECREQVATITTLHNNFLSLQQASGLSDEQNQLICDYIDGRLTRDKTEEVKALIESQATAMRAVLHYQSHVESMRASITGNTDTNIIFQENTPDLSSAPPRINYFNKAISIISHLFSYRLPLVYAMAATIAVFIVVLSLLQLPASNNNFIIATYQDNPTIRFTDNKESPGIGFFSQSITKSQTFEEIKVEMMAADMIKITWPEVDGANQYNMRLEIFDQGNKTVLREASTRINQAIFQLDKNITGNAKAPAINKNLQKKHYEWVLTGNTVDNQAFYTAGGFVINTIESE